MKIYPGNYNTVTTIGGRGKKGVLNLGVLSAPALSTYISLGTNTSSETHTDCTDRQSDKVVEMNYECVSSLPGDDAILVVGRQNSAIPTVHISHGDGTPAQTCEFQTKRDAQAAGRHWECRPNAISTPFLS
ncbi:unnamed protein product [Protopolystoma xenopodis]|uniref:Uncharacterized protein n=1 Tax=Protopolystoma xenopodis TaxID=117903 RepID=A0A448WEC5_9PLAT|nr:unnamed protein product [Protopolystoma xenopodis]